MLNLTERIQCAFNKIKTAYNQMIAKMEGVDECFEQLSPVSVIDADIIAWWILKWEFFSCPYFSS